MSHQKGAKYFQIPFLYSFYNNLLLNVSKQVKAKVKVLTYSYLKIQHYNDDFIH